MSATDDRLAEDLRQRADGGFGWRRRYEFGLDGAAVPGWLAGHYAGLLDDVIRLVGAERIAALTAAADAPPPGRE